MLLTLGPHFDSSHLRRWRAAFYSAFGLSSITFVIHGIVLYGWEIQKSRMSLGWMGWMAVVNLFGATIYAARVAYLVILSLPSTNAL
jgi:adiponectin receptor